MQLIDVQAPGAQVADAEAIVVALKSRTIPAAEAIEKSLAALHLGSAGARRHDRLDSTDAGNIGPVAEALMDALDTDFTLFCPAFPKTDGHNLPRLFVRRRRSAVGIEHARPPVDADA